PEERCRNCSSRHHGGDGEGAIRRLLHMRDDHVRDRPVRADAHGARLHRPLALRRDLARLSSFDAADVRVAVDLAAECADRLREAGEILERMKLRLLRESQRGSRLPLRDGDPIDQLHVGETGVLRREILLFEHCSSILVTEEEVAIDALEVAVDLLEANDLLDAIDGGEMALDGLTGTHIAVYRGERGDAL